MPLDAHARQITDQADYALQMMHYGAALPRCEWGTSREEGIHVRLPNGPAARVLSSLACLRARMRFEAGQTTAAIDDIVAGLTLGRHMSLAGTNVMLLVGYAIEHRIMATLASYVPRLDAPTIKALQARLEALPAGMNTATALATEEKFYLDWLVRKVKEAKDKENLLDLLAFAGATSEGNNRDARAQAGKFLEDCGGSAGGVVKYAEQTRSSYTVMAKKLELPLEQFEKEMERETARQAGNPVFKIFFPALVNVRRAQARTDVRRALLSAALAVQVDGRDTLKNHPDRLPAAHLNMSPSRAASNSSRN